MVVGGGGMQFDNDNNKADCLDSQTTNNESRLSKDLFQISIWLVSVRVSCTRPLMIGLAIWNDVKWKKELNRYGL